MDTKLDMRRETAVIVLLISAVLVPMWFVALASGGHAGGEEIALQPAPNSSLNPTGYFIDAPTEINVNVAGVVTWLGLFGLFGMLFASIRFAHRVGRSGEPIEPTDGTDLNLPGYLESEHRSVVAYWPAKANLTGVWLVGGFTFATVVFAALLASEVFGAARHQFLGFYGALLCVSLAETVLLYYTYFTPSIDVAEERDH